MMDDIPKGIPLTIGDPNWTKAEIAKTQRMLSSINKGTSKSIYGNVPPKQLVEEYLGFLNSTLKDQLSGKQVPVSSIQNRYQQIRNYTAGARGPGVSQEKLMDLANKMQQSNMPPAWS